MVEVFKVLTENESVSYHGSKKAAMDRAMRDVMLYSKYCKADFSWSSNIYRAKFMGEDPDAIAESLTLETGEWHWPECQDLIAVQSSKDGGTTYSYDDEEQEEEADKKQEDGEESKTAEAIKRVLVDYVKELDAIGREKSIGDYIISLHESCTLLSPVLSRTLYNRMAVVDDSAPAFELCDIRDQLHIEINSLSNKEKIMKVIDRVSVVERPNRSQMTLMARLLKALLDTQK